MLSELRSTGSLMTGLHTGRGREGKGGGGDYCASHVNVQDATHITTTNIHIQSQGFGDNPSQQVVVLRNTEEDR